MKTQLNLSGLMAVALIVGCSHMPPRGVVKMKVSDEVANVAIKGVQPGDTVTLVDNICSDSIIRTDAPHCHRQEEVKGVISRVINSNYSEAQFPPGTVVQEGERVEVVR